MNHIKASVVNTIFVGKIHPTRCCLRIWSQRFKRLSPWSHCQNNVTLCINSRKGLTKAFPPSGATCRARSSSLLHTKEIFTSSMLSRKINQSTNAEQPENVNLAPLTVISHTAICVLIVSSWVLTVVYSPNQFHYSWIIVYSETPQYYLSQRRCIFFTWKYKFKLVTVKWNTCCYLL